MIKKSWNLIISLVFPFQSLFVFVFLIFHNLMMRAIKKGRDDDSRTMRRKSLIAFLIEYSEKKKYGTEWWWWWDHEMSKMRLTKNLLFKFKREANVKCNLRFTIYHPSVWVWLKSEKGSNFLPRSSSWNHDETVISRNEKNFNFAFYPWNPFLILLVRAKSWSFTRTEREHCYFLPNYPISYPHLIITLPQTISFAAVRFVQGKVGLGCREH